MKQEADARGREDESGDREPERDSPEDVSQKVDPQRDAGDRDRRKRKDGEPEREPPEAHGDPAVGATIRGSVEKDW